MKLLVVVLVLASGCIERMEMREQQCAHLCIDKYGNKPPVGTYGSYTCRDRCRCILWNGKHVDEGELTSEQWP